MFASVMAQSIRRHQEQQQSMDQRRKRQREEGILRRRDIARRREWAIQYERQRDVDMARHYHFVNMYLRRQIESSLRLWREEEDDTLQHRCLHTLARHLGSVDMDYLPLDMVDRLYGVIHHSFPALLENQGVLQLFVRRLGLFATDDDEEEEDAGTEPAVRERRQRRKERAARRRQAASDEDDRGDRPWIAGSPPKELGGGSARQSRRRKGGGARRSQSERPSEHRPRSGSSGGDESPGELPGAVSHASEHGDGDAPKGASSADLRHTRSGWRFADDDAPARAKAGDLEGRGPSRGSAHSHGGSGAPTSAGGGEHGGQQAQPSRGRSSSRQHKYRVESAQSIDADRAAGKSRARAEPSNGDERFLLVRASSAEKWQPRALHASKSCAIL